MHFSQKKARQDQVQGSLEADHLQVMKLLVVEAEVNVPRLVDHTKDDFRVERIGGQVLVSDFAGDDELVVLLRSHVVDLLEDLRALIFADVEPRNLQVWPEVIDDQYEALGAVTIHLTERELKVGLHLDGATEVALDVPMVVLSRVEMCGHNGREVISHEVPEQR
jgi:hypothetical protein